jgi:hypothetical protein
MRAMSMANGCGSQAEVASKGKEIERGGGALNGAASMQDCQV